MLTERTPLKSNIHALTQGLLRLTKLFVTAYPAFDGGVGAWFSTCPGAGAVPYHHHCFEHGEAYEHRRECDYHVFL